MNDETNDALCEDSGKWGPALPLERDTVLRTIGKPHTAVCEDTLALVREIAAGDPWEDHPFYACEYCRWCYAIRTKEGHDEWCVWQWAHDLAKTWEAMTNG